MSAVQALPGEGGNLEDSDLQAAEQVVKSARTEIGAVLQKLSEVRGGQSLARLQGLPNDFGKLKSTLETQLCGCIF